MDLEHTRFCKFLQVQQNKFVLAEVALRFWNKFDHFWMWSILPLYTGQCNFWALEQALIQLWQPRLNTLCLFTTSSAAGKDLLYSVPTLHPVSLVLFPYLAKTYAQTTLGIHTEASPRDLLWQEVP